MKSTLIATATLAALAAATPLNEKRAYYTTWVEETVTVTVTAGSEPTAAAQQGWGNWGQTTQDAAPADPAPTKASGTWTSVPSAAAGGSGNAGDYGTPILEQHNLHRANHSAPALSWDDDLAAIAQQIAETCVYEHNTEMGGGGYGQNIGAGAPDSDIPGMITNQMYNDEIGYYPGYGGEPDMGNFENWGHFSQIVWKDTTSLGCYTAHCPGGLANTGGDVSPYFTVCNYKPPGKFLSSLVSTIY